MGALAIFELVTPFLDTELAELDFDQSADVVLLTHLNHKPQQLARYGHTQWIIADAAFGTTTATPVGVNAVPNYAVPGTPINYSYVVTAIDVNTGRESLPSAAAVALNDLGLDGNYNDIDWDFVPGSDRYNIYRDLNGIYGFVGGSAGLTFRDDNIIPDLSLTPPGDRDPFVDATSYPARVTFHDQRSFFGRTLSRPNAIYSSQSADFLNLNTSRPARASDAITLGLNARQVNTIQHLVPMKVLVAMTDTAVFSVSGSDGYLTPTNPVIKVEGYRGASSVRPVLIDDICMYATAKGSAIRTIGYQFDRDGYRGNDLTVFVPQFFQNYRVVSMAWAEHPTSTLWCVRSDGKVAALTWQAEQDVWGWSLIDTAGQIEDVCVITEAGIDQAYFGVKRVIDGQTVRFTERLASPLWEDVADANYLDASIRYSGDPATVFSGLDHLEGETVDVLADGATHPPKVVVNGTITLDRPASKVVVGLGFVAWIHTLPGVVQTNSGTSKGVRSISGEIVISVLQTRGIEVAAGRRIRKREADTDVTNAWNGKFYEIKTRDYEEYGSPPDLITGDVEASLPPTDWRQGSTVVIRQAYPLPMTITGVALQQELGE